VKRFFETDHLVADLKGRSVRGGVASIGTQLLKLALQLGATVSLARLLTPQDYGLFGMAAVFTGFLGLFNDLGLSVATVQRAEITHREVSALFWLNAALGLLVAVVALALAPVVAWFYGEPGLAPVVAALAFTFLLAGLAVQHQAILRRQMRFGRIALVETLAILVGTLAGIGGAAGGLGVWALVLMQVVNVGVTLFLSFALCRWMPGRPRRNADVRGLLRFGLQMFGFNAVNYLGKSVDPMLLGWRWGAVPVGFFTNARRLMQLPITQLNAPVTAVAVPALSRIPGDPERYRAAYLRLVEKLLLVAVPGVAYLIVVSDWLVAVLLGPQWAESARLFAILGIAALFEPLCNSAGWLLISQGRSREMLAAGACDAAVRFGLVAVALPFGATGVAVAVVARLVVIFPVCLLVAGRRGPVRALDMARTLVAPGAAALAGAAAALLARLMVGAASPVLGLLLSAAAAAPVALLVLWVTRSGRRALRDVVRSLGDLRAPPPAAPAPPPAPPVEEPAKR
jgi:PST family polysaccharide transporter